MPTLNLSVPLPVAARAAVHATVARVGVVLLYADGTNGSGVLVELRGRYFVFTAAHCVEDNTTRLFVPTAAEGVGLDLDELVPRWGGGWAIGGPERPDAGVVEVEPKCLAGVSLTTRAVNPDDLAVFVVRELPPVPLPMVLSGIPTAQRSDLLPGMRRHLGLVVESVHDPASVDVGRPEHLPITLGEEAIDPVTGEIEAVPDLGGMSGGGTWTAEGARPFLLGTHEGRPVLVVEGRRRLVARTTLVAAHLAVLAAAVPEFQAEFFERWPVVVEVLERYGTAT